MVFYAPTVNSYKRFRAGSWAPTRLAWSHDNRTASFRVVGSGPTSASSAAFPAPTAILISASPPPSPPDSTASPTAPSRRAIFEGDVYAAATLPAVPATLRDATALFEASPFVREALGDEVAAHYTHFFKSEQAAFETAVTDWERQRYFEQI